MQYPLLNNISSPADLKNLNGDQLIKLCSELRNFLIDALCNNPGHFASSLGVVELTVALHYVFNTPYDKLVWDVGHQAYPHKILTGRRDIFHTNRKYKGISGFPKISESDYDAFGTGHSSTSVSAALGMAVASQLKNEQDRNHIAVIGDGSLTAGMAFEAMNHAGVSNSNILVIVNDNGISIDPSVGALKEYLTDITTSKTYNRVKDEVWIKLGKMGKVGVKSRSIFQKFETAIKASLLKQSNLFESLNFRYFGPIDGHDLPYLTKVLEDLKKLKGPKLLHVVTVKGKGYEFAEKERIRFHAPGCFDKQTGKSVGTNKKLGIPPKYQVVFGKTILELAKQNPKVVGITPAMPSGCSLNILMNELPERGIDVGIAEQHAVTFSAGLATQGMVPFCNIYSSFIQRAYDQIIHDVALQKLPVIFCLDRAGLVGEDGPTHHGSFDISFLRCIPNMVIAAPINEIELRNLMYTAQLKPRGPFVIRYPRGEGVFTDWEKPFSEIEIGKGQMIKNGSDLAVISIGTVGNAALEAASELEKENRLSAAVYNLRFIKPVDQDLLHEVFGKFKKIITIEDNSLAGGMGSLVLEFMSDNGYSAEIKRLGIPDYFVGHGSLKELHAECGIDKEGVKFAAKQIVEPKSKIWVKSSASNINN
jgi:1-deoxy-D-xylulose-5-phosphate synthase